MISSKTLSSPASELVCEAAAIAPRPVLIETGDQDPLNGHRGLANVTEQIEIMRRTYRLFGQEAAVVHDVFAGGHRWHGTLAIPWLKEQLGR